MLCHLFFGWKFSPAAQGSASKRSFIHVSSARMNLQSSREAPLDFRFARFPIGGKADNLTRAAHTHTRTAPGQSSTACPALMLATQLGVPALSNLQPRQRKRRNNPSICVASAGLPPDRSSASWDASQPRSAGQVQCPAMHCSLSLIPRNFKPVNSHVTQILHSEFPALPQCLILRMLVAAAEFRGPDAAFFVPCASSLRRRRQALCSTTAGRPRSCWRSGSAPARRSGRVRTAVRCPWSLAETSCASFSSQLLPPQHQPPSDCTRPHRRQDDPSARG